MMQSHPREQGKRFQVLLCTVCAQLLSTLPGQQAAWLLPRSSRPGALTYLSYLRRRLNPDACFLRCTRARSAPGLQSCQARQLPSQQQPAWVGFQLYHTEQTLHVGRPMPTDPCPVSHAIPKSRQAWDHPCGIDATAAERPPSPSKRQHASTTAAWAQASPALWPLGSGPQRLSAWSPAPPWAEGSPRPSLQQVHTAA